jgi:uncharacterized membrane protein YgdD (TMEM256/DUF423 family)
MGWTRRTWLTLAALSGLFSVAFGALAAHSLTDPQAKDWMRTGATYQMVHALACFACAAAMPLGAVQARLAPAFFLAGSVVFCGSLYAMALGAPRTLGAVTPAGGVLLLIGWGVLTWAMRDVDRVRPTPGA